MVRFYALRILKDYIGHIILIGLPVVLISLMVTVNAQTPSAPPIEEAALYIGLVYIIMFQGFGAAYTFEGIDHDFYKPFKDRLRAAPVNPMRFVVINILFGMTISFLQTLVLISYIVLVFNVVIPNTVFVLAVLLLGVIFAQLLAALLIFTFKKAGLAQTVITIYIIAGMVLAGFFFPLPESNVTIFLSKFSSPLAWTHYAAYGFIDGQYSEAYLGLGLLAIASIVTALIVYHLSRKVAV